MVKSVIDPISPDKLLTKRLDTARFWNVALSKVNPSIVLTVSVLIDAVSIEKLLNTPESP